MADRAMTRVTELAQEILALSQADGPRPAVREFADRMEAKLRANDHKPDWRQQRFSYLLARLGQEVAELEEALRAVAEASAANRTLAETFGLCEAVADEAADVANFAMMIADNSTGGHGRSRGLS